MLYYIWVMNMASRYKFSDEEIRSIERVRKIRAIPQKIAYIQRQKTTQEYPVVKS